MWDNSRVRAPLSKIWTTGTQKEKTAPGGNRERF